MVEREEELKSFLMKVKEESEKDLKLNIQKTKIMAFWSHHFMADRWGNNGNSDRLSWAPKSLQIMTATRELKDACSLEEQL